MNPITSTGDSTPKYHPEILGFTGAHEDCREEGTANHVCWKACPAVQAGAHTVGTCACPSSVLALRRYLDLRVAELQLPPHQPPLQQPLSGSLCVEVHILSFFFFSAAGQQQGLEGRACAQGQAVADLLQSLQRHRSADDGNSSDEEKAGGAGSGVERVGEALQQLPATQGRGVHQSAQAARIEVGTGLIKQIGSV
eukprot:1158702-Pelagomonas_calceolata.AAC.25